MESTLNIVQTGGTERGGEGTSSNQQFQSIPRSWPGGSLATIVPLCRQDDNLLLKCLHFLPFWFNLVCHFPSYFLFCLKQRFFCCTPEIWIKQDSRERHVWPKRELKKWFQAKVSPSIFLRFSRQHFTVVFLVTWKSKGVNLRLCQKMDQNTPSCLIYERCDDSPVVILQGLKIYRFALLKNALKHPWLSY